MTSPATQYEQVKSLPFLNACINEGLRLHSTSAMGLPRVIPPGTVLEVCGETFGPGCILSVPSFTIHRDKAVWGEDVDAFRPERWLEAGVDVQAGVGTGQMSKAFNPFSYGPRYAIPRTRTTSDINDGSPRSFFFEYIAGHVLGAIWPAWSCRLSFLLSLPDMSLSCSNPTNRYVVSFVHSGPALSWLAMWL